jgi:hypothetical protein
MLVSTGNFLNSPPDRQELELALLVEGSGGVPALDGPGTDRPPAARALTTALRWARDLVPDYRLQRLLVYDPLLGGRRDLTQAADLDVEFHPPDASPLARRVWLGAWRKLQERLDVRLRGANTIAQPLADAQNRRVLIEAITRARRRLLISSPRLGTAILGSAVVPLLKGAAERGVEITIVSHRRDSSDTGGRQTELEELGVRFLDRMVHAKAIVCDDWVALSSFNFLSFEGYYDQARQARHEFGIRVFDSGISEEVASGLIEAPLP